MTGRREGYPAGSRVDRPHAAGRLRSALLALCLATAPAAPLVAGVASAPAAASTTAAVSTATAPPTTSFHYEEESLEAFEAQLRAHEVAAAEFNKVAHHLHLTLRDGRHLLVDYPGHEQPQLQAKIVAVGVPVTIEYTPKSPKPVHHTIRYVAAGILVVLVILLGLLLVARRRRLARLEEPGRAGASPSPPPSAE
jgi:hypothetical protein